MNHVLLLRVYIMGHEANVLEIFRAVNSKSEVQIYYFYCIFSAFYLLTLSEMNENLKTRSKDYMHKI